MLDPYAGTGSVLVAAAAFGAQVVGTDIDVRVRGLPARCIACPSKYGPVHPIVWLVQRSCTYSIAPSIDSFL